MNGDPWTAQDWLRHRCRELVYRVLEPRGLAFIAALWATIYVAIRVPARPLTDLVALTVLLGGVQAGTFLGSKAIDAKVQMVTGATNGGAKPA